MQAHPGVFQHSATTFARTHVLEEEQEAILEPLRERAHCRRRPQRDWEAAPRAQKQETWAALQEKKKKKAFVFFLFFLFFTVSGGEFGGDLCEEGCGVGAEVVEGEQHVGQRSAGATRQIAIGGGTAARLLHKALQQVAQHAQPASLDAVTQQTLQRLGHHHLHTPTNKLAAHDSLHTLVFKTQKKTQHPPTHTTTDNNNASFK